MRAANFFSQKWGQKSRIRNSLSLSPHSSSREFQYPPDRHVSATNGLFSRSIIRDSHASNLSVLNILDTSIMFSTEREVDLSLCEYDALIRWDIANSRLRELS